MPVFIKVSLEASPSIGQGPEMGQVNQEHPITPGREKLARLMRLGPLQRAHEPRMG